MMILVQLIVKNFLFKILFHHQIPNLLIHLIKTKINHYKEIRFRLTKTNLIDF